MNEEKLIAVVGSDDIKLDKCQSIDCLESDNDDMDLENHKHEKTKKLLLKPSGVAVQRRNERERNRVKHINRTFGILRQHIPNMKPTKKLSKVDTLRCASEYIRSLQQLIHEHDRFNLAAMQHQNLRTPPTTNLYRTGFINQPQQQQAASLFMYNSETPLHHPHQFYRPYHRHQLRIPAQNPVHMVPSPSSPNPSVFSSPSPGYSSDSSWDNLAADNEETEFIPRISPTESVWS